MKKIVSWIVDHPTICVSFLLIVMVASLGKINTLEIDSSAEGLMVEGDPARIFYDKTKEMFGSDTLTIVVVKNNGKSIFTEKSLTLIDELTADFEGLKGVSRVASLATVNKIKGEGGFLNTDKLLDYIPDDPDELKGVEEDALRNEIFINNIISKDGKTAAINIYTDNPSNDKNFNKIFSENVAKIIKQKEESTGQKIYQLGGPLIKVTFGSYIQKDQSTLVPLSVILVIGFFSFFFRSYLAALLPILTGGISILITLGFMAFMGYPINVVTVIVPSILIAVGCTEDAHMISEYFHALRMGKSTKEAVMAMSMISALPITLTSLTTFLGFATLSVNEITILKQFGITTSFGLFTNFIVTVTLIPAILQFLNKGIDKASLDKQEKPNKGTFFEGLLSWVAEANIRYRGQITIITVVLVVLAIIGCVRLKVNTDFISYFKEDSFVRQQVNNVHADMSGALNFNIIIDTHKPNMAKNPKVLKQVAALQNFMMNLGKFDKTISITDYIRVMHREMEGKGKGFNKMPDSKDLVAQYLLLMDEQDVGSYLNNDYSTINVAVRHNITSSWELSKTLDEIKDFVDKNLSHDLTVSFTGENILINNAADAMVKGQVTSLALALSMVFIIMAILFYSLKAGLLAVIANTIPIIFNFGLMGWAGIPLNTGTCMVAAIALGIAIDDTIHFMVRYNKELKNSQNQDEAAVNTIKGEGEPIIFTSSALFMGFGILVLSNFNPTIDFGFLAALVMFFALMSDLFVTPVLLKSVQLISVWDLFMTKMKNVTRTSPVFADFSKWEAKKVILLGALHSVEKGDSIVKQGDEGEEMFMIISGSAKVTVLNNEKEETLNTLSTGDIFGEMAMAGGGIRAATVTAVESTEMLRIDQHSLDKVKRRFPRIAVKLFFNLSQILGKRLREKNLAAISVK